LNTLDVASVVAIAGAVTAALIAAGALLVQIQKLISIAEEYMIEMRKQHGDIINLSAAVGQATEGPAPQTKPSASEVIVESDKELTLP
jgi:hypothetical protein